MQGFPGVCLGNLGSSLPMLIFTSLSLSDFNQSGVLECLWVPEKVETTQELLKRKVRTLLIKGLGREFPEIKQEVGDTIKESCPRNI